MTLVLKILLWIVALVFAGAPIIISVFTSPRALSSVFTLSSYRGQQRDLMFVVVSILAIGILDSFDCIVSAGNSKSSFTNKLGLNLSVFICIVLLVQLFMYAAWIGSPQFYAQAPLPQIPYMLLGACLCAFIARLTLVFGASE